MRRLVCTVLCLGLLAVGLSSSAAGKQEAAGTTGSVTLTEAGTYPIVKDKVTVRFMTVQGVFLQDFATNEFTKFMENKTNVHIEWTLFPSKAPRIRSA
jgi:putative aldouronate transport system substrate-binding protein